MHSICRVAQPSPFTVGEILYDPSAVKGKCVRSLVADSHRIQHQMATARC